MVPVARRKCVFCKQYIDLIADHGSYTYSGKGFYHWGCFVEAKESLKHPWSRKAICAFRDNNEEHTDAIAHTVIQDEKEKAAKKAEEKQAKLKAKQDKVQEAKHQTAVRRQLTDWLVKTYGGSVSLIPKSFYIKLDSVYKGTYKGLTQPVPPEDLFDMWTQKIDFLDKTNAWNAQHGKDIEGVARLNYDLAVILAKYDSYLKWKQKAALLEQKAEEAQVDSIDYEKIYSSSGQKSPNPTDPEKDIDKILDLI